MAVSVLVPEQSTLYGFDFDKTTFELFPSYLEREYFRKVLRQYRIGFITATSFARRLTELVHEPSQLKLFDLCRPVVHIEDQVEFGLNLPIYDTARLDRRVLARRYLEEDFGFRVCGGRDQNCGIFVASVDRDSLAWKSGVRPGFEIIRINGMSTSKATHRMFVDYVKISVHLELYFRNIGMIPRLAKRLGETSWRFPSARDTSTGQSTPANGTAVKVCREPLIFIESLQGTVLGTHVKPHEDGLFVTAVMPGSVAGTAKLIPGDVITEVNGKRLDGLDFEECLARLRCETPFTIRIRRIV